MKPTKPTKPTGKPTEHWANIGELRMRFLDWGGTGAPVLALHGLASSAHWYDLVAQRLNDKFRVIAPDQRGHGQTTQAATGYDWQSLAGDADGLLDHLGIDQAAVLGHSWGCNVGINLAARFPDRVSALVMIDGGTAGEVPARRRLGSSSGPARAPGTFRGTGRSFWTGCASRCGFAGTTTSNVSCRPWCTRTTQAKSRTF